MTKKEKMEKTMMALADVVVNEEQFPAVKLLKELQLKELVKEYGKVTKRDELAQRRKDAEKERKAETANRLKAAEQVADTDAKGLSKRLSKLRREMKARFIERGPLVDGALTATIANDHLLMLGPPGTAKTDFAEMLAECLGRTYFSHQVAKDTTPEEILGMFSATAMIEEDEYRRNTEGVAPQMEVWFLDEIFKSSSALLNAFLRGMEQRIMRNGPEVVELPLESVFAASNEYPEDKDLDALYDRFAMKFWLDYIGDQDKLEKLIANGAPKVTARLNREDLDALRILSQRVAWGKDEASILMKIKRAVEEVGFIASDRTWIGKAPKLVKARAAMNGRDYITTSDWLVLVDALWKKHTDRPALLKAVGNAADPYGARATSIIDGVRIAMREMPTLDDVKAGTLTKAAAMKKMGEVNAQLAGRRDAIMEVQEKAADNEAVKEAVEAVDAALNKLTAVGREITMYRPVV